MYFLWNDRGKSKRSSTTDLGQRRGRRPGDAGDETKGREETESVGDGDPSGDVSRDSPLRMRPEEEERKSPLVPTT